MSPISDEQRAEWLNELAANRAHQEAIMHRQRLEAGEFTLELIRADDDPEVPDPDFQRGLSQFRASLRDAEIHYRQTAIAFDSVDASGHPLPEFIFAIRTLAAPTIAALGAVLGAWLQGRYGRKARLKIGDTEAEARTPEEVERLLRTAARFRDKRRDCF